MQLVFSALLSIASVPLLLLSQQAAASPTVLPPYFPPKTYPNGTANPFYPCPYNSSQISLCPFRCYTPAGVLLTDCYSSSGAQSQIKAGNICTACIGTNLGPKDYPGGCQPLNTYFNKTYESDGGARPSRYGTIGGQEYPACKWTCGEAQVPFNICSRTNQTGELEDCIPTQPQCSSPRVVFESTKVPPGFSLTNGSCANDKAYWGQPGVVACPWRCKDDGSPFTYCSLNNKTAEFTSCGQC